VIPHVGGDHPAGASLWTEEEHLVASQCTGPRNPHQSNPLVIVPSRRRVPLGGYFVWLCLTKCYLDFVRRPEKLDRLTEIAADQGGYLTAAQAERLGINRIGLAELTRSGDLRRVRRGVYATRGTGHPLEQEIAAWLAIDRAAFPWEWRGTVPRAVVSHRSAAALWQLGTLIPGFPSLTVRGAPPRIADLEAHTAMLSDADWQWKGLEGGIRVPVTTPARTVVDLSMAGEEPSYVERALREALSRGLASPGDIEKAARRRPRSDATLRRLQAVLQPAG
jgi:predicted transcriptional regulator of viral defense system